MVATSVLEFLFAGGHVVDIALVVIALEFVVLTLRAAKGARGARIVTLIHALGPGMCLMMGLRCALVDAGPIWIAFWLTASLPLHLWDVLSRKL
jgi:hypothetical protein